MRYKLSMVSTLLLILTGCVTQVTDAGSHVELITPAHAEGCEMIKLFPVQGVSHEDAVHKAINHVAEIGGDSAGISSARQVAGGSEIIAVALKCNE